MTHFLIVHLAQSTVFAVFAGLLTLAFRKNRAKVRYWLWLSASLKFFVPFALLMSLGSVLETWSPTAQRVAERIPAPAVTWTLEQFGEPLAAGAMQSTPAKTAVDWMPAAAFGLWLCGFMVLAMVRFRGWRRIHNAVRKSRAIDIPVSVEVRVSGDLLEPGVVGILRPVLLLPEGILEHLSRSELEAVLAHEMCHVQRRDNLFASLHMLVEAMCWFHPLVWWIGARLVDERERACDEEVLNLGNRPEVYADAILNVCKLYTESPLACVSGVSGSGIRQRIEAIMSDKKAEGLDRAKKLLLSCAGAMAIAGPVLVGLATGAAQTAAPDVAGPKFDVASVKPCNPDDGNKGGRGGKGGGGRSLGRSPGRLSVSCMTVADLIDVSEAQFAKDPLTNDSIEPSDPRRLRGGPGWMYSERYTIEATTDDPVANGPTDGPGSLAFRRLAGPMLQGLLEVRFRLKTHREIEDVPMYALTVAKGGLKLKPMADGDCIPKGPPEWRAGGSPPCGWAGWGVNGPNRTLLLGGMPLSQMATMLGTFVMDRHVVDRTGIADVFNIRLEYAPDENTHCMGNPERCAVDPTSDIPPGTSIFAAMEQQLGLKLVAEKGPHGYIVVDHVERPSEN